MRLLEKAVFDKGTRRTTRYGFVVATAHAARVGIQTYTGDEMGMPEKDVVRVYRPESEVFQKDSLASFGYKAITDNHPPVLVDASNHKEYARGFIDGDVARDGDRVKISLMLTDQDLIDKVNAGQTELSMGYEMELQHTAGVTDSGEPYDAIMTKLHMNHCAAVPAGRAGPRVCIGDAWPTDKEPYEYKTRRTPARKSKTQDRKTVMDVRMIMVDGLSVETTDAGAQAIEKLQGEITKLNDAATTASETHTAAIDTLKDDHKKELDAKDTELAAKDTKIDELEKQVLSDSDLDSRVKERSALLDKANALVKDGKFDDKSDADIKRAVVDSVRGEDFAKDKSDAYVEAAFDMCEVKEDKFRKTLMDRTTTPVNSEQTVSDSQLAYEERLKARSKQKVA